jgi:hypothetical protein
MIIAKRYYRFWVVSLLLFLGSTTEVWAQYPTVYFNELYLLTPANGNSYTATLISGQNFRFVGSVAGASFTSSGNNVAGSIIYINSSGNQVSLTNGLLDGVGPSGGTKEFFRFTVGGVIYVLINPKFDSSYSASYSFGFNSSSPLTEINSFLTTQVTLTATANLSGFSSCFGFNSPEQSFTISGSNLTSSITVTAPTGYEVSFTSGSSFSNSISKAPTSSVVSNTTVYIRLKSSNASGSYTGNIVVSATNSADQIIYVFGEVYNAPAITVQPPSTASVCSSTATTILVTATGGNLTYQWQASSNGGTSWSNLSNAGIYYGVNTSVLRLSNQIDATYSGLKYRVIVSGTCSPAQTSSVTTLTVNSLVSITSQPTNAAICTNAASSFSVAASGAGLTYQWQVLSTVSGSTWTSLTNTGVYTGTTSSTLSLSGTSGLSTGFQYRCVITGTCSTATSSAAALTINTTPSTPGTISGESIICQNTNQSYSVASVSGATSYTWTLPSGWTGTSTLRSINILSSTNSGNISVVASNGCGSSASASLDITVSNLPAPIVDFSINTPTQCLSGNSFTFSNTTTTSSGTISSTTWDLGDGTSASTLNATRTYLTANTFNVNLKVVASNGCIASKSSFVQVNPAPTSSISGTQTVCSGTTAPLTVQLTGSQPWSFTYSDGSTSTNVTNITTSNYTLNVSPASTKTFTISSITDANCSTSAVGDRSGSAIVTVNPSVTASVTIASNDADNSVCSGASVLFTATPTNGGSPVYSWQKNGVDLGASGGTYTATSIVDDDVFSVQMTSNATCVVNSVVFSNAVSIHIAPAAPRTPVVISGATTQCALGVNKSYSIVDVLNATSYTWSVPAGGWTITSGQGTTSTAVTVGTASSTGLISVYATNGCGSSSAQTLEITAVYASPSAPTATSTQTFCASSNATVGTLSATGTSLKWYNSPTLTSVLSSSTSLTTGNYYVTQTSNSCESPSLTITATITANPTVVSTTAGDRCGVGAVVLGASASAGDVKWYDSISGGTLLATGTSYTTISLSSTVSYYVEGLYLGCSSTSRTIVNATIKAVPAVVSVNSAARCGDGSVTLSGTPSAGTLVWYDLANGGTLLATSNTYTTTILSSTTNYYVEALNNGCSSTRSTVTATISRVTIAISGSTTAYDQVSLTASGGTNYSWTGGNNVSSATNSFDESGTYTVTVTDNIGCSSSQSVQVVINIRGVNRYGEYVDAKSNQMNRFGEEGSDFPLKNSGQVKKYGKFALFTNGLALHLDASDPSSYSGTGTNWVDLVNNTNKAVLTAGATYQNLYGGLMEFNGSGAYAEMQTTLSATDNLTIEAWIYPRQVTNQQVIVAMDGSTAGMAHLILNGNQLQFDLSGESVKTADFTFKTNRWYHVAVTFAKGARTVDFYVNGKWKNTDNYTNPASVPNSKYLFGGYASNSNYFFNGYMAGARLFNQSLNANQISNNFNNAKVKFGL